MKLSKRLRAVADLLSDGLVVADIGTDHGYIPIFLVESGKSPRAIAMDINKGPLLRAEAHIREHGLEKQIFTRLSDGMQALEPGECEAAVLAGMGGGLVIKILEEGAFVRESMREWILQPQSEIAKVRQYLCENGYRIAEEDMVEEDGKFYPIMRVIKGEAPEYHNIELRYGKLLLEEKHPVLLTYLHKEIKTKEQIIKHLDSGEGNRERICELQQELVEARAALLRCL